MACNKLFRAPRFDEFAGKTSCSPAHLQTRGPTRRIPPRFDDAMNQQPSTKKIPGGRAQETAGQPAVLSSARLPNSKRSCRFRKSPRRAGMLQVKRIVVGGLVRREAVRTGNLEIWPNDAEQRKLLSPPAPPLVRRAAYLKPEIITLRQRKRAEHPVLPFWQQACRSRSGNRNHIEHHPDRTRSDEKPARRVGASRKLLYATGRRPVRDMVAEIIFSSWPCRWVADWNPLSPASDRTAPQARSFPEKKGPPRSLSSIQIQNEDVALNIQCAGPIYPRRQGNVVECRDRG